MKYRPVSLIQLNRIAVDVAGKYDLSKPTYTVQLAGGGKQVFEYDENSIQDDNTPEEDKELWREYLRRKAEADEEINEKSTAYMFYNGIECEVDQDWIDQQEWLGIDLPDNKFDLKVQYITASLLKTPQDIREAMAEIMKLSMKGADPAAIEAAEKMFLGSLQT